MLKIRALAALALAIVVFIGWYGSERYIAGGSWWWFLVSILGNFFTISATMLFFLTLFAIMPKNGELVIRSDSAYGRVFSWVGNMGDMDYGPQETSLCGILWKTNFFLAVAGYALGLLVSFAITKTTLFFLALALFAGIIFSVKYVKKSIQKKKSCETVNQDQDVNRPALKYANKRNELVDKLFHKKVPPWISTATLIAVPTAILATFVAVFGLILTLLALFAFALIILGFVAAIFLVAGISVGFEKIQETQFGQFFGSLYRRVCPRIRIA